MIFESLADLGTYLPKNSRLLGLDVGSKTIGLAVSNSAHTIATSITTIQRTKFAQDMEKLSANISEREVSGLVLGLPVSMDGSEGVACQSVRQFAKNVDEKFEIGIAFWDERLSTKAIERFLVNEANLSRKRRSEVVDKMAAAYILQGALDWLAINVPLQSRFKNN